MINAKQLREVTNTIHAKPYTRPFEYYLYHIVEPRLYNLAKQGKTEAIFSAMCESIAEEKIVDKVATTLKRKGFKVELDYDIGVMIVKWGKGK